MRFDSLLRVTCLLLPLFGAGCAGQKVALAPMVQDYEGYRREARALTPSTAAGAVLESGEANASSAEALRLKRKDKEAAPLYARAIADARAAVAASAAAKAETDAESCRQSIATARQEWERALRQLEQTERVSGRAAEGITRTMPETDASSELPLSTWDAPDPPTGDAVELRTRFESWQTEARRLEVPNADLEARLREALSSAEGEKVKPEAREQSLYLAGRVIEELEARVREAESQAVCVHSASSIGAYDTAHDQALRAMIDLERGMRDDLRAQLDQARAEAQTRQEDLYDALHKLEGKLLRITQDARGTIVSLADILFDFDKATLKRDVEFGLVKVATVLNQFPEMKIQVEGHTDNVGKPDYNLELSKRRAKAVYDFLVGQEVVPERMTVEGYGMTRPVADNSTDEGRAKNRRVDLVIQENP